MGPERLEQNLAAVIDRIESRLNVPPKESDGSYRDDLTPEVEDC
jgi:hypothetical protein